MSTDPNETSPQSKSGGSILIVFLSAQHQKTKAKMKRLMANVLNGMMFAVTPNTNDTTYSVYTDAEEEGGAS